MNSDISIKKYFLNDFIVRFIIISSILYIFLLGLLYPLNIIISKQEIKEGFKIYLKGLINNPEVLYISANNYFKKNELEKAKIDINLAMGLIGYRCNSYNVKICDLASRINNDNE